MTDEPTRTGEPRTPREAVAQAIYDKMYDPRCDVEGAMWDEAEMWADVALGALGLVEVQNLEDVRVAWDWPNDHTNPRAVFVSNLPRTASTERDA